MLSTNASTASPSQPLMKTTSMTKTTFRKSSNPQLDDHFRLESFSPQDLVDALIAARGETEACWTLQEAFKIIKTPVIGKSNDATVVSPDEKTSSSNPGVVGGNTEDASSEKLGLLGRSLLSEPIETSFLSPRMGKFSLQIYENGLLAIKMNDPAVQLILLKDEDASETTSGVSHVLLFPKPEDCKAIVYNRKIDPESKPKKVGGNLVVLRLESPLHLPKQKAPTQQLCFALPADKKLGLPTGPSLTDEEETSSSDPTEAWGQLLHRALGGRFAQVLRKQGEGAISDGSNGKNSYGFKSYQAPNTSTTTAGMPFVSCYLGVNDGVLYPLEEGLLFYKPPRFLPRSKLHSIACGRGGGGGDSSSRYVDMVVQCSNSSNKDGDKDEQIESVEFTNIQREENTALNSYIHDVLVPAMTRDAKEHSKHIDEANPDADDSDQVVVEAIVEEDIDDDATEDDGDQVEEVHGGDSDDDSDSGDEDFDDAESRDSEAGDSSDDDDMDYGEDDEGIAVVRDEFAQELVKKKGRKNEEESATESEDENSSSGGPRFSKRLRRA